MNRSLRTAFITGATGFVGANLARVLLEEGAGVRALVRKGSDRSSLEGLPVDLRQGDLLDVAGLAKAMEGCDTCFHAAAAFSSPETADLYRTNVEGTRSVLEAAVQAGCGAIVHTSTLGTLGRADGAPARETDSYLSPGASEYVKSKFRAEEIARELASRGAPVMIVHPSAPVGAWDRVPTVTGRRIADVLEGKLPRWIAGTINHVHVRDVARGMVLAARRGTPGKSYLLALEGGNLTREELVSRVARAAGVRPPRARRRFALPGWLRGTKQDDSTTGPGPASLACDPSWTVTELGLPQTPLELAFEEAVRWFRGRG
jgi:dihydroflavonol-4-reductase